jgi:hypothetical protein
LDENAPGGLIDYFFSYQQIIRGEHERRKLAAAMNSTNKKPPEARGIPQPFNRQAGHGPQFKPAVAQLKTAVSAQSVKRPVAPPVYRPQATPNAAQPKMAHGGVNRKPPVAPPVYRPQPVPKVLQTKALADQQKNPSAVPHRPVAPPVYRPKQQELVQPKSALQSRKPPAAPPVYRPGAGTAGPPKSTTGVQPGNGIRVKPPSRTTPNAAQLKPGTQTAPTHSIGNRPKAGSAQSRSNRPPNAHAVIQRMIGFEYEVGAINTQKNTSWIKRLPGQWIHHQKGEVIMSRSGYDITADITGGGETNIEFITRPIDETLPSNVVRLRQIAQSIAADTRAIYNASVASNDPDSWVGADQIPRLNGWWWHRFQNRVQNWYAVTGQLQMTGGVTLSRLSRVLSGSALGQEPQGLQGDAEIKRRQLTKFYQQDPAATPKQPIYRRALVEVNHSFRQWGDFTARQTLASVVALMAQVPIEKRGGFPNDNSGLMLAKTDYSKILHMIVAQVGREIPENRFRVALLNTINAFVPHNEAVNADSDVFPAYYTVQGIGFGGLTFSQWVEGVLPEIDPLAAEFNDLQFLQGMDLVTSKEFPGSGQQKKEMRAFGTFGSKVDPGNKVILEFRNFTSTIPEELEAAMAGIAEYLGTDVNG